MSRVRVEVDIDGTKETIAYLQGIKIRMDDHRVPFAGARQMLAAANAENFASNGLPVGGWAPLDAQYAAWKAVRYPGAPPLIQEGQLFRSLISLTGGVNTIEKTKAEFGTNVKHAKFHQYGTNKMPKREIVFEPAGFSALLAERVAKWTADGLI